MGSGVSSKAKKPESKSKKIEAANGVPHVDGFSKEENGEPEGVPHALRQLSSSEEHTHPPDMAMYARRSSGMVAPVTESDIQDFQNVFKKAGKSLTKQIGEIVVHAAGKSFSGEEAWCSGRYAVMSGHACIRVAVGDDDTETTIATLRRGNCFGWHSLEDHRAIHIEDSTHDPYSSHWESLHARILVDQEEPLRLCHIESPDSEAVHALEKRHFAHDAELEGVSKLFADLWNNTDAPSTGIGVQSSGRLRALFMTALWGPLLDRLEDYDDEIRRRKRRGYRSNDQFPLQGHQIAELRDYIAHVTEIWYGSHKGGNLSALYRWFLKSMDLIGITAYSMDDIPTETSPDGWVNVVDGSVRSKALKRKGGQDALHAATGGMRQKQGRSAIDNTVLVNVFTAAEARVMLLGRFLRKVLCRFIAIRQHCILRRLSIRLHLNLFSHADEDSTNRGHRLVRSILRAMSPEDFSAAGISSESFCFQDLQDRGAILSGFGQLSANDQKKIWEFSSAALLPDCNPQDIVPNEDSEDIFDRLVLWSRKFPGEYFEKDRLRHFEVMLGGIWCDKVVLVKRSAMERMTMARYFALTWTRTQPLWAVFATGTPQELREAGRSEASRVRANECPYARLHGMSLPTGGLGIEERRRRKKEKGKKAFSYSMMMEAQWVQDPAGNIENWFLTDIEKIVQEAWQLNPHGSKSMMLPHEMFVNVGQNPKIGSSIKQTQHTQLCEASLQTLPVLRVCSPDGPQRSEVLDASLDFVDIGPAGAAAEACGFFMKVMTERPAFPALVAFLVELRLELLSEFGGAEALDFLITAVSDEDGGFVILFAPIPQLMKIGTEPPDLASWANPITGESSESAGLEEARVDFGKGVGQFLCVKPSLRDQLLANGEDTLRRIWAFNRVPGVREFVKKFASSKDIFKEPTPTAARDEAVAEQQSASANGKPLPEGAELS